MQTDQKGSITRGDLQKGLLTLRIFNITAKMVDFPRASEDDIDRMDLLQFLVLCAWDDSLNQILSMERSEIEERVADSYNRREEITRAAVKGAVKSTAKSHAILKLQVLKGLKGLPDLFHAGVSKPSHEETVKETVKSNADPKAQELQVSIDLPASFHADGPRPPPARGSQTDRSHGRVVDKGDAIGWIGNGSHTDRAERNRDKVELGLEMENTQDARHLQLPARGHYEAKSVEPEISAPARGAGPDKREALEAHEPEALGLRWIQVGNQKPAGAQEIENEVLASKLLLQQLHFTKEEWMQFGVPILHANSCIKAGAKYFQPAGYVGIIVTNKRPHAIQEVSQTISCVSHCCNVFKCNI